MKDKVTLIIILHNRHANLDRLLEFYRDFDFPIVIADSSEKAHSFSEKKDLVKYIYTPGITYTQKIELAVNQISTPYVALCADDDFVIPEGLFECVSFLDQHDDYSTAQGLILRYYKDTIKHQVRFDLLYKGDYSLHSDKPTERLERLFNPYKSLLYAVHRTSVLQEVFKDAGYAFTNLYLNEYLASIGPVLLGKTMDLPALYQVREHSDSSDDKTAINLDIIVKDEKYTQELSCFIKHLCEIRPGEIKLDRKTLREKILSILKEYTLVIEEYRSLNIPFKKKIGKLVMAVPYIGAHYVRKKRYEESMKNIQGYLGEGDFKTLKQIEVLLKNEKA